MLSREDVARAAQVLKDGGLVAFPTETVYGLGADAENDRAVQRVFEVKGRPSDHPLIVHIAEPSQINDWASDIPHVAHQLAARFWPGPLTLILRSGGRTRHTVTGGQSTVGLRVPAHPVAHALLRAFGGGIAAPSANRFGGVSPTTADHVKRDLGTSVDCILDGGPCAVGIESTILDLSSDEPCILRPGGVTREAIEEEIGAAVLVGKRNNIRAPGLLSSHYAPRAAVVLLAPYELEARVQSEHERGRRVGVLMRGSEAHAVGAEVTVLLPDDHEHIARRLYQALHDLDDQQVDVILTTLPEETGLGMAIADRLRKAAAPR